MKRHTANITKPENELRSELESLPLYGVLTGLGAILGGGLASSIERTADYGGYLVSAGILTLIASGLTGVVKENYGNRER